ncbi:13312_t:CDS:1 [Ambispora leptoticha]|uniref:13312_t:CDS:1 n=1 Tax=Ambispora leptoticha TaxID=144679 RepID=A0A9N9ANN0_9GLOM|nr:13312_t:CDS:1 [Ambispora leptoticha]
MISSESQSPSPSNSPSSSIMPNYFDEVAATTAAASIVNHSDLTTVFDEWLANDLAGFISEGDEDKFSFFQTTNTATTAGDDLSTSSENLSPVTSSTLTTPSANLGFDGMDTPFDLIDSPLFGSTCESFSASPVIDPVMDYFPELTFSDLAFNEFVDGGSLSHHHHHPLIKMAPTTAALNVPVTIPDNNSNNITSPSTAIKSTPQLSSPMSTVASALNIPWDGLNAINPALDETASALVSAILNVKTSAAARTRPMVRSLHSTRRGSSNDHHTHNASAQIPVTTTNSEPVIIPPTSHVITQDQSAEDMDLHMVTSPTFNNKINNNAVISNHSISRNSRKRAHNDVAKDPNVIADELALKRAKNTDAARRSRQRKVEKMEGLERDVAELKHENSELQTRVAVLESEKKGLEEKNAEKDARVRQLEQQLSEAHQRLINKI